MLRAVCGALALALFLTPPAAHAAAFRMTLADGTEIVGTIRAFEDGIYTLATSAGERRATVAEVASIEPIMFGAFNPSAGSQEPEAVPAPEFTFMARNSRLVIGALVSFEDGMYEVRTRAGIVSVAASDVQWIELAWTERSQVAAPTGTTLTPGSVRMAGADAMAALYIPAVIDAYSAEGGGRDPLWSRGPQAQSRTFSASAQSRGRFVAEVRSTGAANAVQALASRQADIAMLSRRMLPSEADELADRGLGNMLSLAQEFELAPSGVAIVVHPSNPIKALRPDQVAGIFSGRIRNWSEVGGSGRRIRVFAPSEGSGALDIFRREVLKEGALLPTAERLGSDAEMSENVSVDTAAIGLLEYASVGNAAALALIDTCDRAVAPTAFNIQTREYLLSTTLYLYTSNKPAPATRAFLDFATSLSGRQALRQNKLPSELPIVRPMDEPLLANSAAQEVASTRIAAQIEKFVANASRASIAIRFAADSTQIGPDAEREINRLADLTRSISPAPRLVLLGFSDLEGDLASTVRLSERRARLVEQRLKRLGVGAEQAFGLGPLRPVACDGTPAGRARNRRVEAWLLK